jgi:virginiamycin A acetyltransferase
MKHYLRRIYKSATGLYNLVVRPNVHSNGVHPYADIGKGSVVMERALVDGNSSIGINSFVAQDVIITKSKIGNYCSIAPSVKIGLGEHDYNNISTSNRFLINPYDDLTEKDCTIGHDVWIGTNAVILRGVHIGNGAVIAANAVVTKSISEFAIVVGIPGRILKNRFSDDLIKKISESRWWEYKLEEAKRRIIQLEYEK